MKGTTRKHSWPVSLAVMFAVVGILAAIVAFTALPGVSSAQAPPPPPPPPGSGTTPTDPPTPPAPPAAPAADAFTSDSTSASAGVKLTLKIGSLPMGASAGSSVVLYLEDDYVVPDSIDKSTVYFTVDNRSDANVNGGGRVYVADPIEISDDDHFGGDDDWDIQVFIPDMNDADDSGYNGPAMGDTLTLVFTKAAGIKNPSEAHDNNNDYASGYKASYTVLGPNDSVPDAPADNTVDDLIVKAKIGLSDEDNDRGYEMTVTGSGFNNGVTSGVYVKGYSSMPATAPSCSEIITTGTEAGAATVGSDDKAVVTFEVTAPTFKPGEYNYLCMVDGEGRMSFDDVEQFELQPSIRVSPAQVSSGDTVTIFAQDYMRGNFEKLELAGQQVYPTATGQLPMVRVSSNNISNDGSATATFEMPGGVKGTVRVEAWWGGDPEDTKITVAPSSVSASKTDVLPNESITLTGNGFASDACILATSITLDNVQVMLDDESNDDCGAGNADGVSTSNAGQFVATVHLSPAVSGSTDPTLIPGTHTLDVEDDDGFTGSVTLTIAEPGITVTPDVAGPRDYITITGQSWPVDNPENPLDETVTVKVKDTERGRTYSAFADSAGRFTIEHQVHRGVAIPSTIQVEVKYDDVVKIGSFDVPVATIEVSPAEAQPGDTVTISATNMPVYTDATSVKIGGSTIGNLSAHTDRDGNITVEDVLVPGLDPGTYSVQLKVKETVAIGEINILAESAGAGAPDELPGAVENLGDNLVAIFHFDDVGKSWSFYDPRPEFAELNTLTEMVNGEAYWILVSESVDEVVLNNKVRSLTCRGDDCWNLEVW